MGRGETVRVATPVPVLCRVVRRRVRRRGGAGQRFGAGGSGQLATLTQPEERTNEHLFLLLLSV